MPKNQKMPKVYPFKAPSETTPLNNRQKLYVKFRVEGLSVTQSVTAAGYNTVHHNAFGCELERKPHIAKALREERETYAKASMMTKKKVMDGFLDAIAQAKMLADPTAQIQGWNSIAKMCGYFEPTKHKIEVSVGGRIVLEKLQTLSDDDLVKLAEGDANVIEAEYVQEEDQLSLPAPNPTQSHDE